MAATTEWTTVERRAAPMTATRLQRQGARHPTMQGLKRQDASHPAMPARTEWPSLGSIKPISAVPKLDFKTMATDATARFARQEAEAAAAAAEARRRDEQERMGRYVSYAELEHRRRLASIPTRCYDDCMDEYDPPEDDLETDAYGYSTSYKYRGYDYEETAEENDDSEEFNAHLAVTKRAGDNSDW